jgi:hypothetical protein
MAAARVPAGMDPTTLEQRLRVRLDEAQARWLDDALAAVRADPAAVRTCFPAVGRRVGRSPLDPAAAVDDAFAWTIDDAARTLLLAACGPRAEAELDELYRYGDAAERRGVLRALAVIDAGAAGSRLLADALRTNDTRLVAAAMSRHDVLDDDALAQAVLKCVFVGLPVDRIERLAARVTPELSRMLAGFALERVTAGRSVPREIWPLVEAHPPEGLLAQIEQEADSSFPDRRTAAEAALADRHAAVPVSADRADTGEGDPQ